MTLEELLEKKQVSAKDIEEYIRTAGLHHIKKSDLDTIANQFGDQVMQMPSFEKIYDSKLKQANRRVAIWVILAALIIGLLGFWRFIIQF